MAKSKVIDADGHIIERSDELRRYLKAPFNKRGGPLTASEPWDRDLQETLPAHQKVFPRAPRSEDWLRVMDEYGIELAFFTRHRRATCRVSASLIMPWHSAKLTTTTSMISMRKSQTV
jgi:hypothetical protein